LKRKKTLTQETLKKKNNKNPNQKMISNPHFTDEELGKLCISEFV